MSNPWLHVIGVGDDGLDGLTPAARSLIARAALLVGGERHQAMVAQTTAERLTWQGGVKTAIAEIEKWRGRTVVVLATGDPMWFGGGANLSRHFSPDEMTVISHPGAFSLTAAAMQWPLADVRAINLHSRALATLPLFVQPGVRIVALCRDGETPGEVARHLTELGFGPSPMTVLEHLGGARERRIKGIAECWAEPRSADLCTLAIECRPGPNPKILSLMPGLPDEMFEHDGQLTKREVRAATVSALSPLPGQTFWDVGAGSGSVGIEWLRAVAQFRVSSGEEARVYAVEPNTSRCALIARNASALGVPQIEIIEGRAPEALAKLPGPDTIFVGGGTTTARLLETCWDALKPGGRLVVNAVTLEGTANLTAFRHKTEGSLTRLSISRSHVVGSFSAFRPMLEIVQYLGVKP